jgi:AcrR family transcriptional regulator
LFPKREARARQTRRVILAAASKLFVDHGYGASTIQSIADEADVAVQTVYAIFGNKRSLLEQLLDVAIAGDDEAVAVNQREWMHAVFTAPTASERLRAYACAVCLINERVSDIFGVLEVAAAVEPDLVELAQTTENRRRIGARSIIDSIRAVGVLRVGLSQEHAIDVLWLLNSSAVFRQLVRRAGWSLNDYQAWLANAMVEELLYNSP